LNKISSNFSILPMNLDQAGYISSTVKHILINKGIKKSMIRRASIAIYEAEINVVIHSFGGSCNLECIDDELKLVFIDNGPGIKNIEEAMREGFSTANEVARQNGFGAGMGLPNIRNSSDYFNISSSEKGTVLTIKFNLESVKE